jgi:hypothetical protein
MAEEDRLVAGASAADYGAQHTVDPEKDAGDGAVDADRLRTILTYFDGLTEKVSYIQNIAKWVCIWVRVDQGRAVVAARPALFSMWNRCDGQPAPAENNRTRCYDTAMACYIIATIDRKEREQ